MVFSLWMLVSGSWRERLETARLRSGKSMRQISLSAGCGEGYYHSIVKGDKGEPKEPGLDRLMKIVEQLDVSLVYVLTGIEMTPAQEQLLALYSDIPDEQRVLLLGMAEALVRGNGQTK